jgi:hypothetical protein
VNASCEDYSYLSSRVAFATLYILIVVKLLKLAKRPPLAISTEVYQGNYSAIIVGA